MRERLPPPFPAGVFHWGGLMEQGGPVIYIAETPEGCWVITAAGPFPDREHAKQFLEYLTQGDDVEPVTLQ